MISINTDMKTSELFETIMVDEIQRSGPWNPKITIDKALEHKSELKFLGSYDGVNVFNTVVRNTMYVLLQKDKKTIGAAMLEKNHLSNIDGWYMTEIGLRLAARGNGHGYGLYKFLLKKGFTLFSGNSQSENGEQVWKNLMNDIHVTVKALRLNMNPDENDSLDPVDINEIDPWDDEWTVLMATKNDLYESVMVDEISANNWWNMSDADMDTKLNIIKMNSLEFFDDINATYSVYSKVDKEFNDRLKKYKLYIYDKNAQRLIGYAQVLSDRQRSTWRMTVHEIALRPSYRGKNIAYDFYLMLLSSGYTVVSDGQQTKGGASIWKRLMNDPRIKVTAYDDVNRREVAPADAWNHENPHAQLKAEMILESVTKKTMNESVEPMTETNIRNGIRYVVGVPLKVFGKIDDIIVSVGQKDGEWMFLFSIGGDNREAIGYASATMKKIHIDKKTFNVLNITDLGLYRKYRRKGIGFVFYNMLLEDGYVLISDETQTGDGEGLWRKLMKQPGIGVTTVKATKSEDKFEHIDLVADDPWTMKNVRIILQAGNQEITEGTPRVAVIQPQPKGLERCTAVTCNALLSHFKKPLIDNAATVPRTAKGCFDLLQRRRLKVQPDITAPQKKVTVKVFANTHQNGAWFIGTPHHALAIIDGELFDTENKGLDGRLVRVVARIVP